MIEYDFLQAKLHGIHSNSFVKEKLISLSKIQSIENLKKTLFPEENILVSGNKLFTYLESKFKQKIITQILYTAQHFNFKNKLINTLLMRYEIDNIKFIINSFYSLKNATLTKIESEKKIESLPEIYIPNGLNYNLIYKSDLSNINNIKKIFENTLYFFINPLLTQNEKLLDIESKIDKFYYSQLLDSLNRQTRYERRLLYSIITEEMNWQNITWAFRLKMFYNKSFENVKSSFLVGKDLIPLKILKSIFDFQFVKKEDINIIKKIPLYYRNKISLYHTQEGDFNLSQLEEHIRNILNKKYIQSFYRENFNILPIVAYIYLKKIEYINIVRVIESLRYNIK